MTFFSYNTCRTSTKIILLCKISKMLSCQLFSLFACLKKTHYNKLHEMISLYLMGNEAANWTQWTTWEYFLWFENNLNIWIFIMVLHKNKLFIKAAFNTKWIILSIQRSICLCHKHICSTKMNRNHYLNNTLYKYLPFTSVSYKCEQKFNQLFFVTQKIWALF